MLRLSIAVEGGALTTVHDFGTELRYIPEAAEDWEFHSATVGDLTITVLEADGSFLTGPLTDDTTINVVHRILLLACRMVCNAGKVRPLPWNRGK